MNFVEQSNDQTKKIVKLLFTKARSLRIMKTTDEHSLSIINNSRGPKRSREANVQADDGSGSGKASPENSVYFTDCKFLS